jgi:hypothetical protein
LIEYNYSAVPLNCSEINKVDDIICFELEVNFAYALGITGGVIKSLHIIFAAITYAFMKITNVQHTFSKHNVIFIIIAEVIFIGLGVGVLLGLTLDPSIQTSTFHSSNPLRKITYVFILCMYFIIASLLWSIYPQKRTGSRFKTGKILKALKDKISPINDDDAEPEPEKEIKKENFDENNKHNIII